MADARRRLVLGHLLRRHETTSLPDDVHAAAVLDELAVISRARTEAAAPRPEFRAELRAQLVAITPRIVAESAAENAPVVGAGEAAAAPSGVAVVRPRPVPRPAAPRSSGGGLVAALGRTGRISMSRPLLVAASLVTVLALVLGGAVFMSREAVPGDTLYGLKRTSEDVRLSFAGNDRERAKDQLEFAATRVDEARTLAGRVSASGGGVQAAGRLSDETASLIASALASADGDTRDATKLLGTAAVDAASPDPLAGLTSWLPQQWQRLAELKAAAPADSKVRAATTQSLSLLATARTRASALASRVDCNCLRGGPSDAFGPLPATGTTLPPASPGTGSTPRGGSTPGSGGATRPGGTTAPAAPGGSTSQQPGRSATQAPSQLPSQVPSDLPTQLPSLKLPQLPLPTGSRLPDLCKINVLGIRVCPSTAG